jgi:hypothetical protein
VRGWERLAGWERGDGREPSPAGRRRVSGMEAHDEHARVRIAGSKPDRSGLEGLLSYGAGPQARSLGSPLGSPLEAPPQGSGPPDRRSEARPLKLKIVYAPP